MNARRLRLPLRFSLRSLLAVTALVAVGAWWHARSHVEVEMFADGSQMRYRQQYVKTSADAQPRLVRAGPCVLLSDSGQLLCRGEYANGQPVGTWTYYDESGRCVLQGPVRDDLRSGLWKAWHGNGTRRATVPHGPPLLTAQTSGPYWPRRFRSQRPFVMGPIPVVSQRDEPHEPFTLAQFGGGAFRPRPWPVPDHPQRSGPVRTWWDNGVLQCEGMFLLDQRTGVWTFHNRTGQVTARREFVADRASRPLSRSRDDLRRNLFSSRWTDRDAALTELESSGTAGTDLIVEAARSGNAELRRVALEWLVELRPPANAIVPALESHHSDDRYERCLTWLLLARCDTNRRSVWLERLLRQILDDRKSASHGRDSLEFHHVYDYRAEFLSELANVVKSGDTDLQRLAFGLIATLGCDQQNETLSSAPVPQIRRIVEQSQTHSDPEISAAANRVLKFQPMGWGSGSGSGFF